MKAGCKNILSANGCIYRLGVSNEAPGKWFKYAHLAYNLSALKQRALIAVMSYQGIPQYRRQWTCVGVSKGAVPWLQLSHFF